VQLKLRQQGCTLRKPLLAAEIQHSTAALGGYNSASQRGQIRAHEMQLEALQKH
jgi:hypothetical protein